MPISRYAVWDVIVPARPNNKRDPAKCHQELADKIVNSCDGLTVLPGFGRWRNPRTNLVDDEEILVYRFTADYQTAWLFANETKAIFDQEAVAFYKVADEMEFV